MLIRPPRPTLYEACKISQMLKESQCPECGREWVCGEDIVERRPVFNDDGEGVCFYCIEGSGSAALALHHFQCLTECGGALSHAEQTFLAGLACPLEGGDTLDDNQYERLAGLYARVFDNE